MRNNTKLRCQCKYQTTCSFMFDKYIALSTPTLHTVVKLCQVLLTHLSKWLLSRPFSGVAAHNHKTVQVDISGTSRMKMDKLVDTVHHLYEVDSLLIAQCSL